MTNVVKFRVKARPSREDAKHWLEQQRISFPTSDQLGKYRIGVELFHGWRFIESDGIVYFAN